MKKRKFSFHQMSFAANAFDAANTNRCGATSSGMLPAPVYCWNDRNRGVSPLAVRNARSNLRRLKYLEGENAWLNHLVLALDAALGIEAKKIWQT